MVGSSVLDPFLQVKDRKLERFHADPFIPSGKNRKNHSSQKVNDPTIAQYWRPLEKHMRLQVAMPPQKYRWQLTYLWDAKKLIPVTTLSANK